MRTAALIAALISMAMQQASGFVFSAPVNYIGDGRTDFVIQAFQNGHYSWFMIDAEGAHRTVFWGASPDILTPADFDGDGRTDLAVWRPGTGGTAAFWVVSSATGAVAHIPFGETGDDPRIVGDYDGDGKADPAVFRPAASLSLSSTWWYKSSATGDLVVVLWGGSNDKPAPGDYDGDGRMDPAVRRADGPDSNSLFLIKTAAGPILTESWGLGRDVLVPGDYDGDGKTDIAVIRCCAEPFQWFIRRSSDGSQLTHALGRNQDLNAQGDYDGDSRTDFAVWTVPTFPAVIPPCGIPTDFVVRTQAGTDMRGAGGRYCDGSRPVAAFNRF
jgi:spore coat protein A, manganese oxidase